MNAKLAMAKVLSNRLCHQINRWNQSQMILIHSQRWESDDPSEANGYRSRRVLVPTEWTEIPRELVYNVDMIDNDICWCFECGALGPWPCKCTQTAP